MTPYHPPSGLTRGIELLIDQNWTPEQALAVFELIDDLRERIWAHYGNAISQSLREQRCIPTEWLPTGSSTDPPF